MVVDLDPLHVTDRCHVDPEPPVDQLLVAVLVELLRVALPHRPQRVGQFSGGIPLDEGDTDVLTARLRRILGRCNEGGPYL